MIIIKRYSNTSTFKLFLKNIYYNKCLYTTINNNPNQSQSLSQQPQSPNKLLNILNNNNKSKNKLIYLNQIKENSNSTSALFNLAINLEPNELIKIESSNSNGINEEVNRKSIYLKIINQELNQDNRNEISNSYNNLAFQYMNQIANQKIQLLNGEKLTKREMYLKSLEINPSNSTALLNLSGTMNKSEKVQINGVDYNKRQLLLKSIELDPNSATAYHNLANCLNSQDEYITLNDGITKMNSKDLYLKSIDLQPHSSNSYFNLATLLNSPDQVITLLNGKKVTEKDLLLLDIDVNGKSLNNGNGNQVSSAVAKNVSCSFNNLGNLIPHSNSSHQIIKLLDGRSFSKKMLYCKAIEIDSSNVEALNNLVILLKDINDKVPLLGSTYSKLDLLIKLIESDSTNPIYYFNLALNLLKSNQYHQEIKLNIQNSTNKSYFSSLDLILKAIDLNPNEPNFYKLLSKILDLNQLDKVTLLNGKIINNIDILNNINSNNNNNNNNNSNSNNNNSNNSIFSIFKKMF